MGSLSDPLVGMGSSSTTTTTTANDQKPSMQRISKHLPTIVRTSPTTAYTTTRNMSLFPRFVENEFAPMFRLLDSYANHAVNNGRANNGPFSSGFGGSLRSFSPKFDIKETDQTYELHGELPGIEHSREEGQRPAAFIEGEQCAQIEGGEKYQKPSVEDENATAMSGANPDASTTGEAAQETNESSDVAKDEGRYWLSERSVGEFARTFAFPNPVDQEKVKASLKDGILSVVVPKASAPQPRRINIE